MRESFVGMVVLHSMSFVIGTREHLPMRMENNELSMTNHFTNYERSCISSFFVVVGSTGPLCPPWLLVVVPPVFHALNNNECQLYVDMAQMENK